MAQHPQKQKFWRYIVTGLLWMALLSLVDWGLEQTPLFKRLENANLDALFASKSVSVSPDVFVVWVTDEDYNDPGLFAGASPLKPENLGRVINAIAECGPRAVGIDFDTSAWFPSQIALVHAPADVPIVWARAGVEARETSGEGSAAESASPLRLDRVLGGAENICYGVPAYFPDEDDVVREYRQYFQGAKGEYFPSLALNLGEVYAHGIAACRKTSPQPPSKDAGESKLINYRGSSSAFGHLSAGALLKLVESADWMANNPLKGKLVLLGGSYRAARDSYPTPVGNLAGVDILANTAQAMLPGGELTLGPHWLAVVGYLESLVLLVAFYFIPRGWGVLVTVITGPVYALVLNWFAFHWGGAFLTFVPCFVGLVVHQIVDHAKDHHKLVKENERLAHEVEKLRDRKHDTAEQRGRSQD